MELDRKPAYLRALKIKSVSVVDQGANQHAHIKIAKRADEEPESIEAEKQVENTDTAFFARIGQAVAKLFHIDPVEKKDAKSFDALAHRRQADEKVYHICEALEQSLESILRDDDLTPDQKLSLINDTADQAAQAVKDDIGGFVTGGGIMTKSADEPAEEKEPEITPEPTDSGEETPEPEPAQNEPAVPEPEQTIATQKGVCEMNFDLDKMTPEERAQLEDLLKRYGVEENKKDEPKDIYKGVDPAVLAEIEELRKFKQNIEEKQIMEVAKKYELLGKKSDELAGVLKSLKAVGGSAYDDMVSMLDSAVQAVEQSKVFSEIGKRGDTSAENPWAKIEAAAAEVCKNNSGMSLADAIDKVCIEHPELVQAYEDSRR